MRIHEAEADIAELLQPAQASTRWLAEAQLVPLTPPAQALATNWQQLDLHYLETVLVTAGLAPQDDRLAGWNLNDDVFLCEEVIAARRTPEDKPFNYEHDCADIIGHTTAVRLVAGDGQAWTESQPLPAKLHVVTTDVLYKTWAKPELQRRMDTILAEIPERQWHVSMECLFSDFDYVLLSATGGVRVVARNQETAFLTRHLRCYGGQGDFQGERVGRALRQLIFSGKGLVRQPANPESVILADHGGDLGYTQTTATTEKLMDTSDIDKQLQDLRVQVEQGLAEVKALATERDAVIQELGTTRAQLETATAELNTLKVELQKTARAKRLQEALGVDEKVALGLAVTLAALSPAQFDAHLEALPRPVVVTPTPAVTATVTKSEPSLPEQDPAEALADPSLFISTVAKAEADLGVTLGNISKVAADVKAFMKKDKK